MVLAQSESRVTMPADRYSTFSELFRHETAGSDYRIEARHVTNSAVVMAPHGGRIEPGTSEIARSVAQDDKSLYLFEGVRARLRHHELHVTSHLYDEPLALEIAARTDRLVAFHGRADRDDPETVWIGGLDTDLSGLILDHVVRAGFVGRLQQGELAGTHPNNICNRARSGRGVQVELPRALRNRLMKEQESLVQFASAVRNALEDLI
ncbi:poly-gamma-glutamate hydrolase family protein [Dinoroseobacter shibae]